MYIELLSSSSCSSISSGISQLLISIFFFLFPFDTSIARYVQAEKVHRKYYKYPRVVFFKPKILQKTWSLWEYNCCGATKLRYLLFVISMWNTSVVVIEMEMLENPKQNLQLTGISLLDKAIGEA